jgi:hypothetical protein
MNRTQRRAMKRASPGRPLPICPPGQHRFGKLTGTVAGEEVAARVVCQRCSRTFGQVMHDSPEDLELFRGWLRTEFVAAAGEHLAACPRRFSPDYLASDGCPGCQRQDAAARLSMVVGV